ncbi:hypothetical protein ACLIR7_05865 [Nitratireductor aquimarinus]|uniref:hypothetical protein n=1 Tax=Nitratireductor aquimarinus TaxID=889300 RepID=UPI00398EB6C3
MMEHGDWISITEAATRLTAAGDAVDRSTLSRYLKQHAEALPLRRSGKSNLVDYDALVAHRGENIRIRTVPVEPTAGERVAKRPATRFAGSQSDGAARKAQADAELREMDVAERRKELTPTSEVDQAGRDAVALMQSAFERAIETEAATVSLKYGWDERTVRIALKGFARTGLDVFHREILGRLDALSRTGAKGGEGETDMDALHS